MTPGRKLFFSLLALSAVATLLVYGQTLFYPFHFDDSHFIRDNALIHHAKNLLSLWTSSHFNSSSPEQWGYRPVTTFIHSLMWLVGDGATWPFHVSKMLVHMLTTVVLALVWRELWAIPGFFPDLDVSPTLCAYLFAAFYAVHPANVEVVTYMSASTTLYSGLFYIAAFYFYLAYRLRNRSGGYLAGAAAAFLLAALAKEEGITLIGIVVVFELFIRVGLIDSTTISRPSVDRARGFRAVGAMAVVAVGAALLIKNMFAESSNIARGSVPRFEYFMTQWRAYIHYYTLSYWPWDFNADNLGFGFSHSFWETPVLAALAANLVILASAWGLRKKYPVFLFAALWFYIAISPASSLIPLAEPVNDRRMFMSFLAWLPALFPWFLLGIQRIVDSGGVKLPSPRFRVALILLWGALALGCFNRARVWSSTDTLWADTLEKNPASTRAMNNLAVVYMSHSELSKAEALLRRCTQSESRYDYCFTNLAQTYAAQGRDSEAINEYKTALTLNTSSGIPQYFYAEFLYVRGIFDEAAFYYRQAYDIAEGNNVAATVGLVRCLLNLSKAEEARHLLDEATKRFGQLPELKAITIPALAR